MQRFFLCVLVAFLVVRSGALAQEAVRIGFPEEIGIDQSFLKSTSDGRYEYEVNKGKTNGLMRFRIDELALPPGAELAFVDMFSRKIQTFVGPISFDQPRYGFAFLQQYATIALSGAKPNEIKLNIPILYSETDLAIPNNVFGDNDIEDATPYEADRQFHNAIKSVVFLSLVKDGDFKVCTAFSIADGVFMTNEHCIGSQEICDTTVVVEGYRVNASGDVVYGAQAPCKRKLYSNVKLDFSIFAVEHGLLEATKPLHLSSSIPIEKEAAVMLQHPAGEPKRISLKGCAVLEVGVEGRVSGSDFTHRCDTLGGSSGSPVLTTLTGASGDNTFACVRGLHHYGFDEEPFQDYNRAVEMYKIVEDLKEQLPAVHIETCK
ncbi:hypothetical protein GOB19_23265 [Sinorhizobium meliloti]|nr:hypothetical protein [Sinorhizobium meliloti]MDX0307820.1 hypothetical protein [Sinorhizobium meliloti]MDX0376910.1 hypothetical protein [Sinorhizobium meliloti]